jgi:hypothetical protein
VLHDDDGRKPRVLQVAPNLHGSYLLSDLICKKSEIYVRIVFGDLRGFYVSLVE